MFVHQIHNSIGGNIYNAFVYKNFNWLLHLHKGYEAVFVLGGEIVCTIENKTIILKEGDSLLITPYTLHSYSTNKESLAVVVVFSGGYVDAFERMIVNKDPDGYDIPFTKDCWNYVISSIVGDAELCKDMVPLKKPDILTLKACLYAITASFMNAHTLTDKKNDNSLIFEILSYIENNFTSDISLHTLSESIGYDYEYISRIFNKTFGINFKMLINQYRCDYAENLIRTSTLTLSDIAMNSGFQSIRSFNRVFKSLTGKRPSEIRE
ncbi:MAG: AraC family transcriptional regulator [Clostridia bacterium]|nr:AraC family transcriptional regulator [Clostridia bacterium]